MTTFVFDTTCVSHFARASRLDVLRALTHGHRRLLPNEVARELRDGLQRYPALGSVFQVDWLEIVELPFLATVHAAAYKGEFGGHDRQHLGEAEVLGWLRVHEGVGIVDDQVATHVAERDGLSVRSTLAVIVDGYRSSILSRQEAVDLVDELKDTDMRLPVDGARLFALAYERGWLP